MEMEIDTIETEMDTVMIERHLHDFQVARFKVLQVFQVLLCLMIEMETVMIEI